MIRAVVANPRCFVSRIRFQPVAPSLRGLGFGAQAAGLVCPSESAGKLAILLGGPGPPRSMRIHARASIHD
jgi:hypothetical protein